MQTLAAQTHRHMLIGCANPDNCRQQRLGRRGGRQDIMSSEPSSIRESMAKLTLTAVGLHLKHPLAAHRSLHIVGHLSLWQAISSACWQAACIFSTLVSNMQSPKQEI